MKPLFTLLFLFVTLAACREEDVSDEEPVRGLKAHLVTATPDFATRRFPAVLEPSEITALSFEIAGALGALNLAVGQRVQENETVASLNPTTLELQVASAQAAVDQARSSAQNAAETLQRQQALLQSGTVTRVTVDQAQVQADAATAQLVQAEKSLETAQENLSKADLVAPFAGIISSVEASSFSTVGAGSPVATMYRDDSFEVSFSVNFDTVGQLVVGTPAQVRLADQPDVVLPAQVSEIGARADAVSSFPIILSLSVTHPIIKAGMAVEAAINLPKSQADGFAIPLNAIIRDGHAAGGGDGMMSVFVFDPDTSRVTRRDVAVGGIRENAVIVLEGLEEGDRIASAGVSFLKDGQEVRLLTGAE
ncbi:efflux RND transporter periplasmic adaptor subunit [Sulfitobacter sp. MF3-043]|uniref:efflux RND transporter periplasmic adaptor subunit n=1 Tax=Sulfitobacter sediminivivens TaxID=3252902 RepID=UPI0036DDDA29